MPGWRLYGPERRLGPGPASVGPYVAQGVTFNGSTYLTKSGGLSGATDTKLGICSFWINMMAADGAFQIITEDSASGSIGWLQIIRQNTDILRFYAINEDASVALTLSMATEIRSSIGDYVHILAAWDLGNSYAKVYLNGVDDTAGTPTTNNKTINYTVSDVWFGARSVPSMILNAEIADFYLNTAEWLDINDTSVRQKFRSAGGAPVDLGSNGSTPTGNAPLIFLRGPTASWHTNKGSSDGFTVTAGALTNAASNPP